MIFIFLLVTTVTNLYPCNGKLLSLPKDTLDRINIETSKDILIYILDTTDSIVKEQKKLSTVCESKINNTISSCVKCSKNLCKPKPPPVHEQFFSGLVSTVNRPLTHAANFVTGIGSNVNFITKFGKDLLGPVSTVTVTLRKAFSKGGTQVFTKAIKDLESVGKSIRGEIIKGFKKIRGKFQGAFGNIRGAFGNRGVFGNFGKNVPNTGNTIGRGVVDTGNDIGKGIVDTGKKIGKVFGGLFGKRSTRHIVHKRCAKRCPQCNKVDMKKKSQTEVVTSICGSKFVPKQKKSMEQLRIMEDIYNIIAAENLFVTKVEYETASLDFTGGRVAFKIAHVTFQTGKITKRYRFPGKFDMSNIDAMGVKISKQIRDKIF